MSLIPSVGGDDADVEVKARVYFGPFTTLYKGKDKKEDEVAEVCVCPRACVRACDGERPTCQRGELVDGFVKHCREKQQHKVTMLPPTVAMEIGHHAAPVLVSRHTVTVTQYPCEDVPSISSWFHGANERGAQSVC